MKPRRTINSNVVFSLEGGNEDNDLWIERGTDSGGAPVLISVWEPTPEERQKIASGHNIRMIVWGEGTPPVALGVTNVPLGKPHASSSG